MVVTLVRRLYLLPESGLQHHSQGVGAVPCIMLDGELAEVAEPPLAPSPAGEWSTVLLRATDRRTILVAEPRRDLSEATWDRVLSRLPQVEQSRIKGLRRRQDRLNSAIGWCLLHRLAHHHGVTAHRAADGRPGTDPPLDLSMSHSGRWTAVAVSRSGRIGIDIEAVRSVTTTLARRCLSGDELAWLDDVEPGTCRSHRFFQLWTAKEAYLKATGVGLAVDPRDVRIDCSGGEPFLLGEAADSWEFSHASPSAGVCITVCAERTS